MRPARLYNRRVLPSCDRGAWILRGLLASIVSISACGEKDVAAAKKKLQEEAADITKVGKKGLEQAKDGIERVQTEVQEIVKPEPELSDEKLVAEAKRAISCKKNVCTVPRKLFDQLLSRQSVIAGQAKTYRVQRGGQTVGVELTKLGPIPKALGFRSGDVLIKANGVSFDSVQGLAQLYVQMKTASSLEIAYRRGKRERTKTITFV